LKGEQNHRLSQSDGPAPPSRLADALAGVLVPIATGAKPVGTDASGPLPVATAAIGTHISVAAFLAETLYFLVVAATIAAAPAAVVHC
jgi:hypothetical protein